MTSCLSNLKQLGLAFTQYAGDYDETYPVPNVPAGLGLGQGFGWGGAVYPYVKSTGIYACPDDPTNVPAAYVGRDFVVSYAYNSDIPSNYYTSIKIGVDGNLPAMTSPSRTVLLYEVSGDVTDLMDSPESFYPSSSAAASAPRGGSPSGYPRDCLTNPHDVLETGVSSQNSNAGGCSEFSSVSATGWHNLGANYLLADCHAKWFMGSSVSYGSYNPLPTGAESTATFDAEGTAYSGAGAHAITFSPN